MLPWNTPRPLQKSLLKSRGICAASFGHIAARNEADGQYDGNFSTWRISHATSPRDGQGGAADFTGDLASPKLGDRLINNVELFDEDGSKVGTGGAVCTIVRSHRWTRSSSACSRRSWIRGRSFLGAWLRFLRPGPWHISAFWAEPATFVKPVVSRNSWCSPPATSTASLT